MASEPQLKIRVNADTSGYQKGMQASKQEVRDLESVSSSALGSIAGALGINAGKVQQLTNAFSGLAGNLAEMGSSGKAAFAGLEMGAGALTAAIAAVPIATLVAGFKALNDEADYFMSLAENDWLKAGSDAFKDAFKGAMHDFNADSAGDWAEFKTRFTEALTVAGGTVKSIFTGFFDNENGPIAGIADAFSNSRAARETAELAREIGIDLDNINDSMSGWQLEWQRANTQIEKYRSIARDTTKDEKTRERALKDAEEAIDKLYADQNLKLSLRANLMLKLNNLTSSTQEQEDAINRAYTEAEAVNTHRAQQLASISKIRANIANSAKAAAKAAAAEAKAIEKIIAAFARSERKDTASLLAGYNRSTYKETLSTYKDAVTEIEQIGKTIDDLFESSFLGPYTKVMAKLLALKKEMGGEFTGLAEDWAKAISDLALVNPFDPVIDSLFEKLQKLKAFRQEMGSIFRELAVDVTSSIGTLLGNLTNGEDAWGTFKNDALGALAELAISVGKIVMAVGFGTEGVKTALESLNGLVAIAAGASLIALGQWAKTSLSNAASMTSSVASYGSASVASSGYGASSSSAYGRTLNVEVTGTLSANGSTLVAVLNNESNRKNYTT